MTSYRIVSHSHLDESIKAGISLFLEAKTLGLMSRKSNEELFSTLISGPEKIGDLWDSTKRVGVAIILDTFHNTHNAAELSLFALGDDPKILDSLFNWALPHVQGFKAMIDLPQWKGINFPKSWLERSGFRLGYTLNEMEKAQILEEDLLRTPIPSDWKWVEFQDVFFDRYYSLVKETMGKIPGAFIPEESMFKKRTRLLPQKPHLLVQGEELVGYVRVIAHEDNPEIALLGRSAKFAGRGVGRLLVQQGLTVLKRLGMSMARLEVAATNQNALKLYEDCGFIRTGRMDVFQRKL